MKIKDRYAELEQRQATARKNIDHTYKNGSDSDYRSAVARHAAIIDVLTEVAARAMREPGYVLAQDEIDAQDLHINKTATLAR